MRWEGGTTYNGLIQVDQKVRVKCTVKEVLEEVGVRVGVKRTSSTDLRPEDPLTLRSNLTLRDI